ncbi:MAG: hypothetical protein KKG47_11810, partial [Proteobacteria bacterium]|nr:hypothetical protein [Pseudomonadota bacterium]MBU1737805.1 hypothetical protein [Pseudomonadota bacterium]
MATIQFHIYTDGIPGHSNFTLTDNDGNSITYGFNLRPSWYNPNESPVEGWGGLFDESEMLDVDPITGLPKRPHIDSSVIEISQAEFDAKMAIIDNLLHQTQQGAPLDYDSISNPNDPGDGRNCTEFNNDIFNEGRDIPGKFGDYFSTDDLVDGYNGRPVIPNIANNYLSPESQDGFLQGLGDKFRDNFIEFGEKYVGMLADAIDGPIQSLSDAIEGCLDGIFSPSDQADSDGGGDGTYRIVYYDPLTLDLDGDGLETVSALNGSGVLFDGNSDGIRTTSGWIKGDDGLLVRDINNNGAIDSGAELFGDSTALTNGGTAKNGFAALTDLDSNLDGKVDAQDTAFNELKVWRDLNQDGQSQAEELFTLDAVGVESLDTGYVNISGASTNLEGGYYREIGTFTRTDGTTGSMADINLMEDTFRSEYVDSIEIPPELQNLPDIQGMGRLRDLREAAAMSPALADILTNYVAAETRMEKKALLDGLLLEWAKTDPQYTEAPVQDWQYFVNWTYSNTSTNVIRLRRGESVPGYIAADGYDQPMLDQETLYRVRIIDAITGQAPTTFLDSVFKNEKTAYNNAYEDISDTIYNSLSRQTHLKLYFDAIDLTIDANGIGFDFTQVQQMLDSAYALNPDDAIADLTELIQNISPDLREAYWQESVPTLRTWAEATQDGITAETSALLDDLGIIVSSGEIMGTAKDNIIFSQDADDLVYGIDGDDTIYTGNGNDTVYGDNGNDSIYGEAGDDILNGGDGNDLLDGGTGADTMTGGKGDDTYIVDDAGDVVVEDLNEGLDTVQSSVSHTLSDNVENLVLTGSAAIDGTGNALANTITGNDADNVINSGNGGDSVSGGAGNDTITTGSGEDVVTGDAGDDTIITGSGNDIITGGIGNDHLEGWYGDDTYVFNIGDGSDTIYDGQFTKGHGYNTYVHNGYWGGNDTLKFGVGITASDLLVTQTATDMVIGIKDPNNPTATIDQLTDKITIEDFKNYGNRIENFEFADGTVLDIAQFTNLTGTAGDDTINYWHNTHDGVIDGGDGNDTINAIDANDILNGGGGADTINAGQGNNTVDGGDGNDVITTGNGVDIVSGGSGDDTIITNSGNDTLSGGTGNDHLEGWYGDDTYVFNIG